MYLSVFMFVLVVDYLCVKGLVPNGQMRLCILETKICMWESLHVKVCVSGYVLMFLCVCVFVYSIFVMC